MPASLRLQIREAEELPGVAVEDPGEDVAGKPELATLADKIEAQLLAQPITAYKNSPAKAAELAQKAQEIAVDAAIDAIWK